MRGIRTGTLCLLVGLLAACDSTPQERINSACTALCGCALPPLPLQQQECIADCSNEGIGNISEACVACISGHVNSCTTLEADCEPICDDGNDTPPPIELVDAPSF
ncbi:MAG: hypothetical protein ABI867_32250 [Kofleriaceae bacterium]